MICVLASAHFNYWRGYIRSFSDIVAPLVALTRKHVLWRWRDEVEGHALRTLKQALLDSPVLISPNPDKPFFVVTDASNYAVGASLEQEEGGEGSRPRPVAFFSASACCILGGVCGLRGQDSV